MDAFIADLWNVIKVASPLGAMLAFVFMLLAMRDRERERSERIAIQKTKDDLHERTLNGLSSATFAVDKVTTAVQEMSRTIHNARQSSD